MYVKSILNQPFHKRFFLFFVPAVLYAVCFFTFVYLGIFKNTSTYYASPLFFISTYGIVLSYIAYAMYSLRLLKQYVQTDTAELSPGYQLTVIWSRWLLHYLIIRASLAFLFLPVQILKIHIYNFDLLLTIYVWTMTIGMLLILLIASYFILRNPAVFDTIFLTENIEQKILFSLLPTSIKPLISNQVFNEIKVECIRRLEQAMVVDKHFLDNDLTQRKLADALQIPVHQMSRVLNQELGQNFNEYINTYRINYAKHLLSIKNNRGATVYGIAIDSGFKSESVFYTAFKHQTGCTPNQYRKIVLGSLSAGH